MCERERGREWVMVWELRGAREAGNADAILIEYKRGGGNTRIHTKYAFDMLCGKRRYVTFRRAGT